MLIERALVITGVLEGAGSVRIRRAAPERLAQSRHPARG